MFHLCSAVTRRLMTYLRTFMLSQTFEVTNNFSTHILSKFWGEYQVLVWNLNKQFTSFIGSDINNFIINIPQVLDFIDTHFEDTDHLDNLCTSLGIWYQINPFLNKMKIHDADTYEREMLEFTDLLKQFYKFGSKTFLAQNTTGEQDTFYLHCLRFYLPGIAKNTWENTSLGLVFIQCRALNAVTKNLKLLCGGSATEKVI